MSEKDAIESLENNTIVIVSGDEEKAIDSGEGGRKLRERTGSLYSIKNKDIKKRSLKDHSGAFKSNKDVKKFYLNINKNVKVKPALLETIFEEEEDAHENPVQEVKLGKAAKRSLIIKDGYKPNKTLTIKRKNIIKKKLGHRKKPKKVATLQKFIEDFKQTQKAQEAYQDEH